MTYNRCWLVLLVMIVNMGGSSYCMLNGLVGASLKTLWDLHYYRENGMISLNNNYREDKNRKLDLVLWKGYGYSPEDYIEFGTTIQNYGNIRDLNINVFIPSYNIIPRCCKKNSTILFGHSDGGFKCLKNSDDRVIGKVTYGATHNSEGNLYNGLFKIDKLDIPSLSMIGQYDGFISYMCLLDEICGNLSNHDKHHVVCVRNANHLCIVKNKELRLSKMLFGLNDNVVKLDYKSMMNTIASITVDYFNYIVSNYSGFERYVSDSRMLLGKTSVYNITNFVIFLQSKSVNKRVMYIHDNGKHVYVKSYGKSIRDKVVNTRRCFTTLEWIMRKDNDTILYFKYDKYMYLKIPSCIYYHVSESSFWFDMYLVDNL
jgi:hypothetical protein